MPISRSVFNHIPYLTQGIEAIACRFKQEPEDFEVEEIPAYEPCGEGEHLYLWIEKRNRTSAEAMREIARAFKVGIHELSAAGLKDARGLTRQWISVRHPSEVSIPDLPCPEIKILKAVRHRNKLRIGHLRGNRFKIRLRGVEERRLEDMKHILQTLSKEGLPNYFGGQRFGVRGDNASVGLAILKNDFSSAVSSIAGSPDEREDGPVLRARTLFESGDYDGALKVWPRGYFECRRLTQRMAQSGGNARKALLSLGKEKIRFFLSALQSRLFNDVLGERLRTGLALFKGDLAYKHDNGAVFLVEDPAAEKTRWQGFEISPSGPLFGYGMSEPAGEAASIESRHLQTAGLCAQDFRQAGLIKCKGARRALRVPVTEIDIKSGADERGAFAALAFTLPKGTYATALLREIGKDRLQEGALEDGEA